MPRGIFTWQADARVIARVYMKTRAVVFCKFFFFSNRDNFNLFFLFFLFFESVSIGHVDCGYSDYRGKFKRRKFVVNCTIFLFSKCLALTLEWTFNASLIVGIYILLVK